jgi:hypothetical protein
MQTGNYHICLSLAFYIKEDHKFHDYNIYDTENTIYALHLSTSTENGVKYKDIWIGCYSTELTENIRPKEYANIVFDMIGVYLTSKYKKISKEITDSYKNGMDYNFIESFNYPAVFEKQKYLFDENEASCYDGEKLVPVDTKKEYKQKYNE